MSKFYRCGFCGVPTSAAGTPMPELIPMLKNVNELNVIMVDGDCCTEERQHEEMMQVTREMAIDAGDITLEGMWIRG